MVNKTWWGRNVGCSFIGCYKEAYQTLHNKLRLVSQVNSKEGIKMFKDGVAFYSVQSNQSRVWELGYRNFFPSRNAKAPYTG
jgi:hypothetical protein